jgi:dipeptidyl aminopeptidase/acylaminoacyl peptidase
VAAAAVVVAAVIAVLALPRSVPLAPADAVRFDIARPEGESSPVVAISPDGRRLAFIATRADGTPQMWVRSLATQEARPLEGAKSVTGLPFWSADSRYLLFSADGKLRKIDAAGGPAQPLADVQTIAIGGSASKDDKVLYSDVGVGIFEVPSAGGTPHELISGAVVQNRGGFVTPSLLPSGDFVYCRCAAVGTTSDSGIYMAARNGGVPRKVLPDSSSLVQYAPSPDPDLGYLLFVRRGNSDFRDPGTLMAQPIDPRQGRLLGDPVAIAEHVSAFSASETGVLVYSVDASIVPTGIPGILRGQLTWFDRAGRVLSTVGEPGVYRIAALSPDGQLVAIERIDTATQNLDIYVFELARGVNNRFTFDAQRDVQPVWSPDGTSVIYTRFQDDQEGYWYRRAANLAGDEELLFRAKGSGAVSSLSPDGRFALFTGPLPGPADIQVVDLAKVLEAREAIPLVTSQFNEVNARFSPDGRWFAYASNESGSYEIYVRPFNPDAPAGTPLSAGGRVMMSKGGATGGGAIWRADGKELFYLALDGTLMSVAVETQPTLRVVGPPAALFKVPRNVLFFDVSPDGDRFLIAVPEGAGTSAPPYKVVLNWTSTLK